MTYSLKTYHFGTEKDGMLDYGVYEVGSVSEDAPGMTLPEIRLRIAAEDKKFSVDKACIRLYESIPEKLKHEMNSEYNRMAAIRQRVSVDLITIEFDDMMFVRYCRLGQWFSFAERSRLGLSDQTRYGDKRNYFAVWDGSKWCDPTSYDIC